MLGGFREEAARFGWDLDFSLSGKYKRKIIGERRDSQVPADLQEIMSPGLLFATE